MKYLLITIFTVPLFLISLSVYSSEVCVVNIDPRQTNWSSIDNCKKNDILDVLVFNAYDPNSAVPNYPMRLIAHFCDYNKSIVIDKMNKLDENAVSFTCIKRN